jgi:spectinomycin phosphotransferase/16S rRNA (guanine(1405)-N(7))-methyltransferase
MTYRPVGFGSHHWEVADSGGTRWFVTADELRNKRVRLAESLDTAFVRLRAALAAATDLRASGLSFVVAPVPAADGEPLVRAGEEFGLAVYPFVAGQSFAWGEFSGPAHRDAVLDLLIEVHTAPRAAWRRAMIDDYAIPHRDELEAAINSAAPPEAGRAGPFAQQAASLLAANQVPLRRLLARYDDLAALARAQPGRRVLTHGEPHPGNTMLTSDGWRLIDWDTVVVAEPERDLWSLDPGDESVLTRYGEATGVRPLAPALELYRIRWDLADIAVDAGRFRSPHQGTADDEASWELLRSLVEQVSSG